MEMPNILAAKLCRPIWYSPGCRIIDIRPTKSLGLILDIMHQINLRINFDV
jgi:hypothetical protein